MSRQQDRMTPRQRARRERSANRAAAYRDLIDIGVPIDELPLTFDAELDRVAREKIIARAERRERERLDRNLARLAELFPAP